MPKATVKIDSITTLEFAKSDFNDVLSYDDISYELDQISNAINNNLNYVPDLFIEAKKNTTYEQFQLEGFEQISDIIDKRLLKPTEKIIDTEFPKIKNKIIELQQQQTAKDNKIINAYNLAQTAKDKFGTYQKKHEEHMHQLNVYKGTALDSSDVEFLNRYAEKEENAKKRYELAKEEAIKAYNKAVGMEPKGTDDYEGMSEVTLTYDYLT